MSIKDNLHVRRCHVCGDVTESETDVLKCGGCGKSLLPFYYFDKKKIKEMADGDVRPDNFRDLERDPESGYGPIRGLTAYW
ncbi:MAG: hypothetical protein IT289_11740 [Oligoflexia bacterium]|nr:hypothetical protein [Oligoflexia bacterium]